MLRNERADIICLNCGRSLAEVELTEGRLRLLEQDEARRNLRVASGQLWCVRCGGRGFVERRLLAA